MQQNPQVLLTGNVQQPLRLPRKNDIWTPKSGTKTTVFCTFDFEMCFAPQWRAFFRRLNFQKWSGQVCFVHFDFEMCFAPQRRSLFRYLNFQKWSDTGELCTFWLGNALRATTVCNFPSLIWPHGSAPAALASLLFDPPEPSIIGKTQCVANFLPFRALGSSFFSLFRFWVFFLLLFSSLLFSESSHLCFSSVHIVGSWTSKLPFDNTSRRWWKFQNRKPIVKVSCCESGMAEQSHWWIDR